jgi:hypothetical protein
VAAQLLTGQRKQVDLCHGEQRVARNIFRQTRCRPHQSLDEDSTLQKLANYASSGATGAAKH